MKTLTTIFVIGFILQACSGPRYVESKKIEEWKIDGYRITYVKKACLAGPNLYEYRVYKNGFPITSADPRGGGLCVIKIRKRHDLYVFLDICNQSKSILKSHKRKLVSDQVDSIVILPYDSLRLVPRQGFSVPLVFDTLQHHQLQSSLARTLSDDQSKSFISMWNNSKTNSLGQPPDHYNYLIRVYQQGEVREFKLTNYSITENGKWFYHVRRDDFIKALYRNYK